MHTEPVLNPQAEEPQDADVALELERLPEAPPVWRPRPCEPGHALGQAGCGAFCEPEVFVHLQAAEVMLEETLNQADVETGGLLLGEGCQDQQGRYVQVLASLPARLAECSSSRLTFTHRAWNAMLQEREALYPQLQIVGWYHTHPGLGVFLSPQDEFIHRSFFRRWQDVAMVIDGHGRSWGVFRWREDRLELAPRFFIMSEAYSDAQGACQSERLGRILSRLAAVAGAKGRHR